MILGPAAPTTAPELGKSLSDPMKMYLSDIYTVSVNLAGLPGISIPVGHDAKGLPIGMQMIGDCLSGEETDPVQHTHMNRQEAYVRPELAEAAEKGGR